MTQPATFEERARTLTHSLLTDAERIPSRLPRGSAGTRPWKAIALFAVSVLVIGGAVVGASVALHSGSVAKPLPANHATPWKSFLLPGGVPRGNGATSISCPDTDECVAVDLAGHVYVSTSPGAGTSAWKVAFVDPSRKLPPGEELTGVSCPVPSLCVAVDGVGNVVTSTNPGGGAAAWRVGRIDGVAVLNGISCPDVNLCVAIGGTNATVDPVGLVITSTGPADGPRAWTVAEIDGMQDLTAISCASETFCVATDGLGNVATSTDPAGGTHAWHVTEGATTFPVAAIDCPTAHLCVGADSNGGVVTSTDPSAGAWTRATLDASLFVLSVSCPTTAFCIVGAQSDYVFVSSDPTGGSHAWRRQQVITRGLMSVSGLSCPSASFCVGVGYGGARVYMNPSG